MSAGQTMASRRSGRHRISAKALAADDGLLQCFTIAVASINDMYCPIVRNIVQPTVSPALAAVVAINPQVLVKKSPAPLSARVSDDGRAVQTAAIHRAVLVVRTVTVIVGSVVVSTSPVQASLPLPTPPT